MRSFEKIEGERERKVEYYVWKHKNKNDVFVCVRKFYNLNTE